MKIGTSYVQFKVPLSKEYIEWYGQRDARYRELRKQWFDDHGVADDCRSLTPNEYEAMYEELMAKLNKEIPWSSAPAKYAKPYEVPFWKLYATDNDPLQKDRPSSIPRVQLQYCLTYNEIVNFLQSEVENRHFIAYPRQYTCKEYGRLIRALDKRGIEYGILDHGMTIIVDYDNRTFTVSTSSDALYVLWCICG